MSWGGEQVPANIDTDIKIFNLSTFLPTFLPYRRAIWVQITIRFKIRYRLACRYGKKFRKEMDIVRFIPKMDPKFGIYR